MIAGLAKLFGGSLQYASNFELREGEKVQDRERKREREREEVEGFRFK